MCCVLKYHALDPETHALGAVPDQQRRIWPQWQQRLDCYEVQYVGFCFDIRLPHVERVPRYRTHEARLNDLTLVRRRGLPRQGNWRMPELRSHNCGP